jgi:hypothetical protein
MRRLTLLAVLVIGLTGCQDPYRHTDTVQSVPRSQSATVVRPAPDASARAFAERWVNWDWRTAAARQRELARMAAGALATQLRANAGSARIDATLARDRPRVRGTVTIVDLAQRREAATGLVVTREQTYTNEHADLGGPRYHVYRVSLIAGADRWEVTRWAPQP